MALALLFVPSLHAASTLPTGAARQSGKWTVNLRNIRADVGAPEERRTIEVGQAPAASTTTPGAQDQIQASGAPTQMLANGPEPFWTFNGITDNLYVDVPGTSGAVGRDRIFTTLNSQLRVQERGFGGSPQVTTYIDWFWSSEQAYNPKVTFDVDANRFYFASLDLVTAGDEPRADLLLALSTTADPGSDWLIFRIPVDHPGYDLYATDMSIGYSTRSVVITVGTASLWTGGFTGTEVFVLDKAMLQQNKFEGVYYYLPNDFGLAPTTALTFSEKVYLVDLTAWWDAGVRVRSVDAVSLDDVVTVHGRPWSSWGPWLPQLGGNAIDGGDDRMQNAVYRSGTVYAAQTVFLPVGSPTHAAAQYWEIALASPQSAVQYTVEDTAGARSYAFPSVAANVNGDVLMGFSSFSATQYPSAAYSHRIGTDAPGVISKPMQYKAGLGPWRYGSWGPYSATVVDGSNGSDFWTLQEYGETGISGYDRWGTWWARVRPPFGHAPELNVTSSSTTASLSWVSDTPYWHFTVQRTVDGVTWTNIQNYNGLARTAADSTLAANKVYAYRVRAFNSNNNISDVSPWSNIDTASTLAFTDDPLTAGASIKGIHMTELRSAVNAVRAVAGLPVLAFSDNPLPLLSAVRATHLRELRSGLNAARAVLGLEPLGVTDPTVTARQTGIRAVHLQELRNAVK